MVHYRLSVKNPASHDIDIELTIDQISSPTIELQLPAWRPGRYELGNFAKNIKSVRAFNETGQTLVYTKLNKDLWVVYTNNNQKIRVTYSYHTSEINAGNCYADDHQIYVNPVHLCMYIPSRMDEQHVIELEVPDSYTIATSLKKEHKTLIAESYDELADSPIIASATIQSDYYEVNGTLFWIHLNGECQPDFSTLKVDFKKFTETQCRFWGDFPVKEYHFLFQILPVKFYHGVEHQSSTVIAIGPGHALNQGKVYENVLGVSSHELFHTWNVKYIRPIEMLPYDFTKENYARTGYVYEGFTTYYGDLMLLTSGVFTIEQYFETLEERLVKHLHNEGRFNLSVAHSSWETWLDGYVPGAPYRKTSIYDEGCLVAFMLDTLIMKHTNRKKGLKDVCRVLYMDFGKKHKGYTEHDVISICEQVAGKSLSDVFTNYVYGTENYEPMLLACFAYLGIEMQSIPSLMASEKLYGIKTLETGYTKKITLITPDSPAWKAGLSIGDDIIAVNGYTLKNDFNERLNENKNSEIELTITSNHRLKTIKLPAQSTNKTYFDTVQLVLKDAHLFAQWVNMNS